MTLDAFLMQHGGTIIAALIYSVPAFLAAYWSKRGVAVSRGNANALSVVQDKQDTNRTAIIEGVKHELKNGAGDAIAAKTAAHITPVIEAMAQTIPVDTAKIAEGVAAALVEAKLTPYEGEDRRGPIPGRRATDQE